MNDEPNSNELNKLEVSKIDFQLLRIIVIDSYCAGKKVELKLDGHVSLNGANGAGKTTLLRLIPIFFGESPKRVIFGKEPFATYYFPTTSSYIIYEYQRRDTKVLAVIHADGQSDSVAYRFIDSPYEDRLFRIENGFVQSQDIYKHLQSLNISITKPLSRSHYEQILTNNSINTVEQRNLAARFSFVGTGSRLTHMNRVISGILNRVTEFSDLKRMVVSTILGEEKQFTLSTKRNELMKWIRELQAHQSLEEKRPLMASLEEADANRVKLLSDMGILHSRFHSLVKNLEEVKSKTSTELEDKKNDLRMLEESYSQENRKAENTIASIRAAYEQTKKEVDTIRTRFKAYKNNGIDADCTLVDSLLDLQKQFNALGTTIDELSGEIKNVDDKFEKLQSAEALNFQEQKTTELLNRNTVADKYRNEKSDANTNYEAMLIQFKQASDSALTVLRSNEHLANNKVVELEAQQPLVVGDASIEAALKQEQFTLVGINASLKEANQVLLDSTNNLNQAQRKFEDQERICNDVSQVLEEAELEHARILDFSSAGKDTLIGFLRAERPDWVHDIGRIINEDVLLRKDLEPELVDGSSLYGVNINLNHIKDSKLANEEKIQLELSYANTRIKNSQLACNEEDANLKAIAEVLKEARTKKQISEANQTKFGNASKEALSKVELWTNKLEYSKKEAVESIRLALESAKIELEGIQSNIGIEERKMVKEISSKNKELSELLKNIGIDEQKALKAIADKEKLFQERYDNKIIALNNSRLEMLAGKGVDPEYLKMLESDKSKVSGEITSANEKSTYVHNYRIWLEDIYAGVTQKELEANQSKINLDSKTAFQASLKTVFELKEAVIKNEIVVVDKKMSNDQKAIINANNQLESLSSWPRNQVIEEMPNDDVFSLVDLINNKNEIVKEQSNYKEIIANGVYDIRQEMLRVPGSITEQYCLAVEKESGRPNLHHEYQWLHVCRKWFNEGYKSNHDSILSDCRTQGMNIRNFCESLEKMRTDVSTFNREIRSSLGQAKMFAKINSVDINITTDIDKQDYWQAINELKGQYDMWQPIASNTMPPMSFVDAANDVAKIVNDERGLVANPTDLINIRIDARINDKDVSAKEENELKELSSNGLSYLVLAIVMVGFVNKIRGKNQIAIPYAVDEVKDLDYANSVSLLEFLALNNIILVGAFPDVDERLSPHFKYKYSVLDDKQIASVEVHDAELLEEEVAYV